MSAFGSRKCLNVEGRPARDDHKIFMEQLSLRHGGLIGAVPSQAGGDESRPVSSQVRTNSFTTSLFKMTLLIDLGFFLLFFFQRTGF